MASQGETDAHASTFQPDWRFYLAFASICVICLMAALDATSLAVAIPKITLSLHGTAIEGFWFGTSFLLTSTVFQPVFGSFSDIFGRKNMVYTSLVLFGVGAILAAVAHDTALMLVGRSIQGIGGGGVLVLSEIIVTDLVPLRFRGQYYSLIGAMQVLSRISYVLNSADSFITGGQSAAYLVHSWAVHSRKVPLLGGGSSGSTYRSLASAACWSYCS
jgi:MFS family permease